MEEIYTNLLDMPTKIKGMTIADEEGNYHIFINPRYSYEMQKEIYEHELKHISNNHFYNDELDIKGKEGGLNEVLNMNRIKELRENHGWTQAQLGEKIQVQTAVILKYETEEIPLVDNTIKKLADIFGVTTDYLLGKPLNSNADKNNKSVNEKIIILQRALSPDIYKDDGVLNEILDYAKFRYPEQFKEK